MKLVLSYQDYLLITVQVLNIGKAFPALGDAAVTHCKIISKNIN